MTHRWLLLLISASLLAAVAGLVVGERLAPDSFLYFVCSWGLTVAQFSGLALLLQNGTFLSSPYFRLVQVGTSLALVGALFKIEHWTGGDVLLPGALAGIGLTYSVWFARKKLKTRLDVLKLLWVLTATLGGILILWHRAPRETRYLSSALLWLAVFDLVYQDSRRGRAATASGPGSE